MTSQIIKHIIETIQEIFSKANKVVDPNRSQVQQEFEVVEGIMMFSKEPNGFFVDNQTKKEMKNVDLIESVKKQLSLKLKK